MYSIDMVELVRQIDFLRGRVERVEKENEFLREQLRLLTAQLYGRKSERLPRGENPQLLLFDERVEKEEPSSQREDTIEIPAHRRSRGGRKPLPENLPRVEIIHDVSEDEKRCGCGAQKQRIGEEVAEQLDIVPARIQVLRHIRPKYACRQCEGVEDNGPTVVIAPPPAQLIPKSMASAGLLAHILVSKFADALPFYRQEAMFRRLGVDVDRTSMCIWAMQVSAACKPLLELLSREIRSGPLINIDETTVQVLKEPGRRATSKSYMWVFRGGPPDRPALEFLYHPTREGRVASDYLADFHGFVQTDGYSGYDFLDRRKSIVHMGCWAHVRRKFVDVLKAAGKIRSKKKTGVAEEAIERIKKLYEVEQEAGKAELASDDIVLLRQKKAAPVITEMHSWLTKLFDETPPKSLLGKAIAYALGQWPRLSHYLSDGRLRPDNNLAENAIRPFVVGRKNWLFSGSVEGATASARLYSLIETAKANDLEPYWYLRHVLQRLPASKTEEDIKALLPQYIDRSLVAVQTPA